MNEDALHLNFTAEASNVEPWLGEGWHGAEAGHRWTDGVRSVLRTPPFPAQSWFVLTIQCWPFNPDDLVQTLTVELNGVALHEYQPLAPIPHAIAVPGELVRADGENVLVFHHPHAASPALKQPGGQDARTLALAFQKLSFEPLDNPFHAVPRVLAEVEGPDDPAEAKAVVEAFQSLGLHCGLGVAQRHYKTDPQGLFRFAGLWAAPLIHGLTSRFASIGDLDKLSFRTHNGGWELQGRHSVYLLDYHTERRAEETDIPEFTRKEAQRLAYLARLLIEQLENDEKIFVRLANFQTPGEALALHRLLCAYNPRARLLIVEGPPERAPERAGRVIELRPGLYRGYFAHTTNPASPTHPAPEEWLRLCATVVAYERGRG
jgi:hypothetical protein